MPKNEMSYNLADKIITLYSNLLMNLDKLKLHEKYPYSALNGYDIIDISNAVKLNIAYRVFISDDKKPNNVAEYTEASSVALLGYLDLFYPNNIATELNAIYGDDIQAFSKKHELTKDILKDIETQLYNEETPKSFLEYCISTGKSDPDYWKKIYDRIGITWDSSDDYDKIYINIALQYGLLNTKKTNVETKKTKSTLSIIKTPLDKFLSLTLKEFILILVIVAVLIVFARGFFLDNYYGNKVVSFLGKNYYLHSGYKIAETITGIVILFLIFYFIIYFIKRSIKSSGGIRSFILELIYWGIIISAVIFGAIQWGMVGALCSMIAAPFLYFGILKIIDFFKTRH